MSEGIAWVYEDHLVERSAMIMSERQVWRLPVVDRDERISASWRWAILPSKVRKSRPAAQARSEILKRSAI